MDKGFRTDGSRLVDRDSEQAMLGTWLLVGWPELARVGLGLFGWPSWSPWPTSSHGSEVGSALASVQG